MTGLVGHLIERRKSIPVKIGSVTVGGDKPIVVQSMTNTDTADIDGTVEQVEALHRAGSEIVRITVDREEAAQSVPYIKEKLLARGVEVHHLIARDRILPHTFHMEALVEGSRVTFPGRQARLF